jgi:hypothetical protein
VQRPWFFRRTLMHENFANHNHNSQKSRALAPTVKTPRPCHACARYSYEDASSGKADRRGSQPRLHNKSPLLIVADRPRVISIQLRNTISVLIMRIGSPIHESEGGIAKSTMRRDSPIWQPHGHLRARFGPRALGRAKMSKVPCRLRSYPPGGLLMVRHLLPRLFLCVVGR